MIFARAATIVVFHTSSIYFIFHQMYTYAIAISAGISLMWTLNVKDLAISNWGDRLAYIFGGILGTTVSLYALRSFFEM